MSTYANRFILKLQYKQLCSSGSLTIKTLRLVLLFLKAMEPLRTLKDWYTRISVTMNHEIHISVKCSHLMNLIFNQCLSVWKTYIILHTDVIHPNEFYCKSALYDINFILFTIETWCGIFHCYWWTALIKPRLLFSLK